jgi:tetratricopeptide (TPR) repeat protein
VALILFVAFVALTSSQSAQTTQASRSTAATIQKATAAAASGDLAGAEADYSTAIAAQPTDAALRIAYGNFLLTGRRYADAIVQYREVLRRIPQRPAGQGPAPHRVDAEIGLASAYRGAHNYDEAKRELGAAHLESPRDPRPLAALGDLEIELQSYDSAITQLKSAAALRPSDVEIHERLLVAYKAKGDAPDALAQASAVLAHDPKNAVAFFTRAEIYADQNKNELARKDAERVVELQPRNARGRALLGKILLRTPADESPAQGVERCKHAVDVLEPLTADPANPPDSDSLFLMARAYQCSGEPDKAAEANAAFEKSSKNDRATKENQTQAKHLVEEANALAQKNDLDGAEKILDQAIDLDPTYGPTYSQLAKIYYSEGKMDEASDAIGKALDRAPNEPEFLYVRGKILEKQNRLEDAVSDFERTVAVDPGESDAFFEMGQIYQQMGNRAAALKAYEAATRLAPNDPDYKRALDALRASQ